MDQSSIESVYFPMFDAVRAIVEKQSDEKIDHRSMFILLSLINMMGIVNLLNAELAVNPLPKLPDSPAMPANSPEAQAMLNSLLNMVKGQLGNSPSPLPPMRGEGPSLPEDKKPDVQSLMNAMMSMLSNNSGGGGGKLNPAALLPLLGMLSSLKKTEPAKAEDVQEEAKDDKNGKSGSADKKGSENQAESGENKSGRSLRDGHQTGKKKRTEPVNPKTFTGNRRKAIR